MDLFRKQKEFIDQLETDFFSILRETISGFDFVVKDYIINKQLFREGIDSTGEKMPGYKRVTIRYKIAKGDPADRRTLRDSGEFYESIMIEAFDDRFEVSSNVPHAKWIIYNNSDKVLGLTKENINEFLTNYYLPKLKSYVANRFSK